MTSDHPALMPRPLKIEAGEVSTTSGDSCDHQLVQDRIADLCLSVAVICEDQADQPSFGVDESYILIVGEESHLTAATVWGALHGLTTLSQLAGQGDLSPRLIEDAPRLKWRGLKLDCVRHFMPVALVKQTLDAMAFAKLNVLHWGLTNYQGWRVESLVEPRLHQVASNGDYYTQDQVKEIVAHAASLGVRVVPELNAPGHSTAILIARPDLAAGDQPNGLKDTPGVFDDEMHPRKEEGFRFLDAIVGEWAALFPDDYVHIGGDEVTGKSWEKLGFTDKKAEQAAFTKRYVDILGSYGKKAVGWEEVAHGEPDPDSLTLQAWMTPPDNPIMQPYQTIVSTGFYLDHHIPAATHHGYDPFGDDNVIGAEACSWTEAVDQTTLPYHLWPRLLAVGERFWSTDPNSDDLPNSVYDRMDRLDDQLEAVAGHKTAYEAMLTAKGWGKPAVRLLMDCVTPVLYFFIQRQPYSLTEPLKDVVSNLRPESSFARTISEADLPRLQNLADDFGKEAAGDPMLEEMQPVASTISALAKGGDDELWDQVKPIDLSSPQLGDLFPEMLKLGQSDRPQILKQVNIAIWQQLKDLVDA